MHLKDEKEIIISIIYKLNNIIKWKGEVKFNENEEILWKEI